MAALDFAAVSGSVWYDLLVADTQLSGVIPKRMGKSRMLSEKRLANSVLADLISYLTSSSCPIYIFSFLQVEKKMFLLL